MNKNENKYNGWTNWSTWAVNLWYFDDPAHILECIEIDIPDAINEMERVVLGQSFAPTGWTLRNEVEAKFESYADALIERLMMFDADGDDIQGPHADFMSYHVGECNTREIAAAHCGEVEVSDMMKEHLENMRDEIEPDVFKLIEARMG